MVILHSSVGIGDAQARSLSCVRGEESGEVRENGEILLSAEEKAI